MSDATALSALLEQLRKRSLECRMFNPLPCDKKYPESPEAWCFECVVRNVESALTAVSSDPEPIFEAFDKLAQELWDESRHGSYGAGLRYACEKIIDRIAKLREALDICADPCRVGTCGEPCVREPNHEGDDCECGKHLSHARPLPSERPEKEN